MAVKHNYLDTFDSDKYEWEMRMREIQEAKDDAYDKYMQGGKQCTDKDQSIALGQRSTNLSNGLSRGLKLRSPRSSRK
tara:strand:+ start:302 stop:535 length:234 start_codon:yes stop_codon:yes gene_type:complete